MISEAARLAALRSYGILDTPPDPEFDRIAAEMAHTFQTPSAIVSFIDEERQWYKAKVGVAADAVARSMSFCTHSIKSGAPTVVPDARLDERFRANPAVQAPDGIRFYASAPIRTPTRARIGTVCVFDRVPRTALPASVGQQLVGFAEQVIGILERRRAAMPAHHSGAAAA